MSDEVEVPFGDKPGETATLLLAAAEQMEKDPSVVRTGAGVFYVPEDVRDRAFDKSEKKSEEKPKKSASKKTVSKKSEK